MPRLSSAGPLELYLLWAATPAALGGVMWEQGMSAGTSAPAGRRRRPTRTPSARTFPLDATQQKKSPSSSEPAESHRQGGSTPWPTRRSPKRPNPFFDLQNNSVREEMPYPPSHARVVGNDPAECENCRQRCTRTTRQGGGDRGRRHIHVRRGSIPPGVPRGLPALLRNLELWQSEGVLSPPATTGALRKTECWQSGQRNR
jgi:hypothetical protein